MAVTFEDAPPGSGVSPEAKPITEPTVASPSPARPSVASASAPSVAIPKTTTTLSPPISPANNRLRSISNVSTSSTLTTDSTASNVSVVATKRQRDFESLFGPQLRPRRLADRPTDFLVVLQTQSADLQASVLLHGRLYLTSYHLCFRSNIVGFVTEKIYPLTEIVRVERSTTAKWIQNAVSLTHVKENGEEETVGYGSMKDREAMYRELTEVWRSRAPERYSAFMKKEKEEEVVQAAEGRASVSTIRPDSAASDVSSTSSEASSPTTESGAVAAVKQGGGRERAVSEVRHTEPSGEKFEHVALDTKIPIPMDQLFDLLYNNKEFHMQFLKEQQKLTGEFVCLREKDFVLIADIKVGEWAEVDGKKQRNMTYVMHMNNMIGPKKSDCLGMERLEKEDADKAYEIVSETQTPDIPSGKSFKIRTRTCLSHTGLDNNETAATRLYCTTQCDWSASSMLKGTITPAVIKGQKDYHQALLSAVKGWIKAHPEDFEVKPVSVATAPGGTLAAGEKGEKVDVVSGSVEGDAGEVSAVEVEKGLVELAGEIPGNMVMRWITILLGMSLLLNWYLWTRRC